MAKYKIWWQEWDKNNIWKLVHDYIPYDEEKLLQVGRYDVVNKCHECIHSFEEHDKNEHPSGLIYGGIPYDFHISVKGE